MKVDKNLLPMKGHYFLFNAGTGLVIPFMPTLGKELGFSAAAVGVVYTCLPILSLVVKPTMGALADRFHCQKGMFISFILLTMVFLAITPWTPRIETLSDVSIHCNTLSDVKMCSADLKNDSLILNQIGNQSIHCKFSCTANSTFVESICESWHQPQFCATVQQRTHRLLLAVHKNATNKDLEQSTAKVFSAIGPQTLTFSGVLNPSHTELIKSCLFMRLEKVNFTENEVITPYCNGLVETDCKMTCDNAAVNRLDQADIGFKEAVQLYQFWIFSLSLIFGWVCMAVVVSVSDAICFELLGEFPSKYGYQRLWGSIGWGTFSFLGGIVIDQFSKGQAEKNHTPVFIIMVVVLAVNVLVAWKLKYIQVKTSPSIVRDIGRLLTEGRVLIFLLWCIAVGMCTALVWNFLFWHLELLGKDEPNIKTLEGLIMMIQCFGGELPFFFLSGWVLKKFGHIHAMTLVLCSCGVRFLLYSVIGNPWYVLPIELLNGPTFGLAYATMASYASIVAPPGTEATMQGLVGAVFEGLGVAAGSFLGGFLMDPREGGAFAFRLFGIGALLCCIAHSAAQCYFSRRAAVLTIHEKDFQHTRYASPNDAIHMLEDSGLQDMSSSR